MPPDTSSKPYPCALNEIIQVVTPSYVGCVPVPLVQVLSLVLGTVSSRSKLDTYKRLV